MVSPPDAAKSAALAGQAAPSLPAKADERAAPGAALPVPAADLADIRPLDLAGALQILISEVRAELDLALLSLGLSPLGAPPIRADRPEAAVRSLVASLLDAYLKESPDFDAFQRLVPRLDAAWQTGSTRALELVADWKEVPGSVVDALREVTAATVGLLDETTVIPAYLGAEWLLQPRLEYYRRRRRRLRRWLTDPGFRSARLDEDSEPR